MSTLLTQLKTHNRQRGSVLVIFAISLVGLMGLAALAVDLGAVYAAKNELQNGADAAAMAAVHELENNQEQQAATYFASLNTVMNDPITLDGSDVVTGQFDFASGSFTPGVQPTNAVQVTARRTANSPDGPVGLFFGRAIGINSVPVEAQSIAAIDNRISGIRPAANENQADLLPFAVKQQDVGHVEDLAGNTIEAVDFEIDPETGDVTLYERVDLNVRIIGTQITYGAGGPDIPVRAAVTINGGQSYIYYNSNEPVSAGDTMSFEGVEPPFKVGTKARATYNYQGWTYFDSTRYSNTGSSYVLVLRDGDIVPEYEGFDGQDEVTSLLEPFMDPETREVTIGINDVIFLYEFVSNLNSSAADFQDLVVLCSFEKVETEMAGCEARFAADVGRVIDFFPEMDDGAPGNFGTLDLNGGSNGTAELRDFIENGFNEPFVIPSDPGYITVDGDPGMSAALRHSVEKRLGDTVVLPVYDQLSGQGANAEYRVPFLVAVELQDMKMTGPAHKRYIRAEVKELVTDNLIPNPSGSEYTGLGRHRMAR